MREKRENFTDHTKRDRICKNQHTEDKRDMQIEHRTRVKSFRDLPFSFVVFEKGRVGGRRKQGEEKKRKGKWLLC